MAPEDLREYAGLTTTVVTCKQRVPMYAAGLDLIRWSFESMFGAVVDLPDEREEEEGKRIKEEPKKEEVDDDDYDPEAGLPLTPMEETKEEVKTEISGRTFKIMDAVTVRCRQNFVEIEWEGNVINDGVADACLAILTSLESSPAAVKRTLPLPLPLLPASLTKPPSQAQLNNTPTPTVPHLSNPLRIPTSPRNNASNV